MEERSFETEMQWFFEQIMNLAKAGAKGCQEQNRARKEKAGTGPTFHYERRSNRDE